MDRSSSIRKLRLYMLMVSASLIIVQNTFANPNNSLNLLSPVSVSNGQSTNQITQEETEPFVKRTGNVSLGPVDIFRKELALSNNSSRITIFKGKQLVIGFFPEREITVIVDSESYTPNNIISLGGHQVDSDISTFSMTITQGDFLITYQDIENGITYRVVGNVETGLGKVVEIDLKKLPPRYDSEPVIPPEN